MVCQAGHAKDLSVQSVIRDDASQHLPLLFICSSDLEVTSLPNHVMLPHGYDAVHGLTCDLGAGRERRHIVRRCRSIGHGPDTSAVYHGTTLLDVAVGLVAHLHVRIAPYHQPSRRDRLPRISVPYSIIKLQKGL